MRAIFARASATGDIDGVRPDDIATGMRTTFAVATVLIIGALAIVAATSRYATHSRVREHNLVGIQRCSVSASLGARRRGVLIDTSNLLHPLRSCTPACVHRVNGTTVVAQVCNNMNTGFCLETLNRNTC